MIKYVDPKSFSLFAMKFLLWILTSKISGKQISKIPVGNKYCNHSVLLACVFLHMVLSEI